VELIERAGPIMTAYIEYLKKDDADMAIQNTKFVAAFCHLAILTPADSALPPLVAA
jgi:hypothetical protein